MSFTISYIPHGRFGNNLFQYIATKLVQFLIKQYFNIELQYIFYSIKQPQFILNESNYKEFIHDPIKYKEEITNKHIFLDGYFQYDEHILKYNDLVKHLFQPNANSKERINSSYLVEDFIAEKEKYMNYKKEFETSLVLHLRLDDFFNEKLVVQPSCFIELIKSIFNDKDNYSGLKNCVIIVDRCKYPIELQYIQFIVNTCNAEGITCLVQSGDSIWSDFFKLYYSSYLISSNSTFSYMASMLGEHNQIWCPKNTCYSHQTITKCDETTISFQIQYL